MRDFYKTDYKRSFQFIKKRLNSMQHDISLREGLRLLSCWFFFENILPGLLLWKANNSD
jgi:hypothetical protein